MNALEMERMKSILSVGENVAVEFKRCGNGVPHDVYESICSFLNRFGGDLFMGILDDLSLIHIYDPAFLSHVAMLEENFAEPKKNHKYL